MDGEEATDPNPRDPQHLIRQSDLRFGRFVNAIRGEHNTISQCYIYTESIILVGHDIVFYISKDTVQGIVQHPKCGDSTILDGHNTISYM